MKGRPPDRVSGKCRDCKYFSFRDHVPLMDQRPFGQHLDGWCSKIFPRGYVGAGKPGGKRYHGDTPCFQYEWRGDQENLFDMAPTVEQP